jgi:hypothetical protein
MAKSRKHLCKASVIDLSLTRSPDESQSRNELRHGGFTLAGARRKITDDGALMRR